MVERIQEEKKAFKYLLVRGWEERREGEREEDVVGVDCALFPIWRPR